MAHIHQMPCGCPRTGEASRAAGVYVVRRSAYVPQCNLGAHAHAEDRIILTREGRLNSIYSGGKFCLDSFRAMYRPAGIRHRDSYAGETVCLAILLPKGERRRSAAFTFSDEDLPGTTARLSAELEVFDRISELVIESLIAQILGRVWSRGAGEKSGSRWVSQIRDWIEDEYADPPSLREIAAFVARDASHVATTFRRIYGKSIGEYARGARLWRARKLVENATIPLAEVAQLSGFADQSHFSRLFKRGFGVTPAVYRRRASVRAPSRAIGSDHPAVCAIRR